MTVEIDTTIVDTILNDLSQTKIDNFAPNWINKDFLEKHLQSSFSEKQINIINFEVKPATAKGENYASYLYRVRINYTDELQNCKSGNNLESKPCTLSIVIKTAVLGDFAFEAMLANDVYTKEIEFYSKLVPKMNAALEKLNETTQLLPKVYGVCLKNNAIIFEDLRSHNYCIGSVHRGFNFDQAKVVLRKAATLHAVNAVLQEEEPDIFANFKYGLMTRHTDVLDTFYLTQLDVLMEVVSTWPDRDYYMEKLQRVRNNLMEKGAKAFSPEPNHFNTLIHGDMWVNNLMLKHVDKVHNGDETDESIENIIFLDFQYSCWTSPSVDLHYFFNNSLEESLRPSRFDDLIAFYHEHLTNMLKQLGYQKEIPFLEQFKKQYLDKSFYAFVASCLIQPLMINEDTEEADIEALIVGDERSMKYKRIIYSSPKVNTNLRKLIPMYDSMGVFD